jgi:hypothetical protein
MTSSVGRLQRMVETLARVDGLCRLCMVVCVRHGLYWWAGSVGFPFGTGNDPSPAPSILGAARAAETAPMIAVLGLIGGSVAWDMAASQGTDDDEQHEHRCQVC